MRPLIVSAAAIALLLGACRNNERANNEMSRDDSLTAENIVSNDVTAIDAVTADAANMAADVDYAEALANLSDNGLDSRNAESTRATAKTPSQAETATNSE